MPNNIAQHEKPKTDIEIVRASAYDPIIKVAEEQLKLAGATLLPHGPD